MGGALISKQCRRAEYLNISISKQKGYAVLLVVIILALSTLTVLVGTLQDTIAALNRDEVTTKALAQAKDALIGWSAAHKTGPGHLLCPAVDEKGQADTISCGTVRTRVGRLPWKELGLPDLRDGYGEQLWYAVSRCFLERSNDSYCETYSVNSDTEGQLRVEGEQAREKVVAIIFSPGAPTYKGDASLQQRATAAQIKDVTNYLEGKNADGTATPFEEIRDPSNPHDYDKDIFESRTPCLDMMCVGGAFNDRMVQIRANELFSAVENAVANRLGTEIGPMLRYYRDQWASITKPIFPFAAPAKPNQATVDFCGVIPSITGQISEGLLPISEASSCIKWLNGSVLDLSGTGRITNVACASPIPPEPDADRLATMVCQFDYSAGAGSSTFQVNALVKNAAMTLALPIKLNYVKYGVPPSYDDSSIVGKTITQSFLNGDLDINYTGEIPAPAGSARIVFPIYSARTKYPLPAGQTTAWFFNNEWYRLTSYAAISQRLANSSGNCTPGTDCLTIQGVPISNDKEAVLVLAGTALKDQTRPSSNISDYWEWQNISTGDRVFEKHRRTSQFNDQIRVVSP